MSIVNRIVVSLLFGCLFVATLMFMSGAQITSWYVPQSNPYLPQGFEFSEFLKVRPISSRFWNIFRSLDTYFNTVEGLGRGSSNPLLGIPTSPSIPLIENADGFLFVLNLLIMFVNGLSGVLNAVIGIFNF